MRAPAGPVPAPVEARCAIRRGQIDEIHLSLVPRTGDDFPHQLAELEEAYRRLVAEHCPSPHACLMRRYFLSDVANQAPLLRQFLGDEAGPATALVGQAPVGGAKVALWAYLVHTADGPLAVERSGDWQVLTRGEVNHCWGGEWLGHEANGPGPQSRLILDRLEAALGAQGLALEPHLMRTWLTVRDIDNNYQGMVAVRRAFFSERGLRPDTHYVASTGIEAQRAEPQARIGLDAYAVAGLRPGQRRHLKALSHLSPTDRYGVTFERATLITYGDRRHIWVSGTASIDHAGAIVHPDDIVGQMERTFANISALLAEGGATLEDMACFIVYLRDPSDHPRIARRLATVIKDRPCIVVQGAVCRPGWLIEIEGVAIVLHADPDLPPF